ncbi:TonB-dependent receptor [uncultured Parasphingorhabdus sp.]|uniref:TonB-dependent receptor n=1 Tax=uncultured Parasphingorhabdus sp. TaxID=2709694 RepID=UPI0030D82345
MNNIGRMLAVALCTTAITSPAFAQDSAQEAESFDDNVIIVTATRRAQDVQDIPLAVTAVGPVQLERQGVVSVSQITNVSSSFSVSNAQLASGSVVLRIRGVGTTSNNIGFESAVGIFIDGAYQSRPGVALSEFVDVERVEILRGPQGTLFGRNTSAGALNITNKRPNLSEFGGFANATYGNRDLMGVQGAVNVPIVEDKLALRVTGAYRERDGYVTVVDGTGTKIGDSNGTDQYLVRGQLGFETDGGIRGRLIADHSKSTAGCCAAVEVLQSPLETSGLLAAVGLGARGGMAGPVVALNPFDTTTAEIAADNRIATANFAPQTRFDQWGITGEVEVPLGDSTNLIYIGSYREYDATEAYDNDFSALDVFNVTDNRTSIETMTHELRVQGDLFGGALKWLVGGYYSEEDISQQLSFALGADYDQLVGAILAGATGGASLNPLSPIFFGTTPLQNITGVNPATVSNINQYAQNSKSWSVFTHNVLEVTDGLELTVGLRYSDESKDGSFASGGTNNAVCPAIVGAISPGGGLSGLPAALQNAFFGLGCFAFTAPADAPYAALLPTPRSFNSTFGDSELIYTGKVAYAFADPVNIYASFTHGYKSGGFNLDSTAAVGGTDPRFLSEEVDSYEIGLKAKFLDNAVTLNLAVFREQFSNFQIVEYTGVQFRTFNVAKAVTQGLEIETMLRPSDHFTVNAALTYTDAYYPGDCAGTQTTVNVLALCGNSLTNAPDFVGIAGATYTNDIGMNLAYFLNGQVRFEGDRRTSTQAVDPINLTALPFVVQDSNIKINLRAGIGSQDEAWGIEAFVTNLTNEVTRGVTFATILRSGSQSVFVQDPRSYGLTLRGKF